MTLIAEDLLLLLLDDESGALRASSSIQTVLGGALLAELAIDERVVVGEKTGGIWKTAKIATVGAPPTDPVLAAACATIGEKERTAQDLVLRLGKGVQETLIAGLVDRGILEERKDRALGIFPRTRWPALDSEHEDGVRRALADTLLEGLDPDPRTGALVALLAAVDQAHRVLEHQGLPDKEVERRASAVADGEWAAQGVSDAITATNAAVMAAITVSTVAATASPTSN